MTALPRCRGCAPVTSPAMARPPLPPPPLLDPAWYPDPTGRYEARYWDGRKWTSHISHYGATGADPLLRARFDHWWLRGLFRVALWAAFFGAIWWAYNEYWPTDERDLAADEDVAGSAVLAVADLPVGWTPAAVPLVSPLTLTADDEGTLPVEVSYAAQHINVLRGAEHLPPAAFAIRAHISPSQTCPKRCMKS